MSHFGERGVEDLQPPSISRPLYLNTEDTLLEVGITRRQLGHWQEKALITPELGTDGRRYTVRDIERLKVLKRLIVDQQFPLDFVKQLADRSDEIPGSPLGSTQYLDIDSSCMRTKDELGQEFWDDFLVQADEEELAQRLYDLWLILARVLRAKYRTDASYTNRRDEIRRITNGQEFTGRIECSTDSSGELQIRLDPHIEERSYSDEDLIAWLRASADRIAHIQNHAESLKHRSSVTAVQKRRLWSQATFEAMEEKPTDFDDVPF